MKLTYRPEIDGLRALAVISVIFFHAGLGLFSGGFVGVDIFFVISGFLITSIIISEREAGTFSFIAFYERRARRILPALFFVVACTALLVRPWMVQSEFTDFCKSVLSISLFSSNYYFRQDTGYFAASAEEKPLLHTWSLAVEEQYYFVFPLLLGLLWRLGTRRLGVVCAFLGFLSLTYAEWRVRSDPEIVFFDTIARVWELLSGSIIAIYVRKRGDLRGSSRWSGSLSVTGLGLILFAICFFDETVYSPSLFTLIPIVGAMLVILFANQANPVGKLLSSRPCVGVGLISYSAYLWHQPLLALGRLTSLSEPRVGSLCALSILAIILAYPTWRFIECPFRSRVRVSPRATAVFAVSATIGMAALGTFVGVYGAFPIKSKNTKVTQEVLEQLQEERRGVTKWGKCQFVKEIPNHTIDDFLREWQCDRDPDSRELKRSKILVVGDSHSADIASALRTNGYLPVQIGGPGCSLVPKMMSPSCEKLFTFIREWAQKHPEYSHILLANRWEEKEVTQGSLRKMIAYWSLPGRKLVFVSSVPEFSGYKRGILRGEPITADFRRSSASSASAVAEILKQEGVIMVDSGRLFCSLAPNCGWVTEDGELLTTDGHHLSRRGAELFGEAFISLGVLPLDPP